ncbi:hypothetical protein HPB47_005099 [Ixodes persulcatus]|uniref:Uncharacterized protein n=1 Tax=Ixodes persulcatus TaxID=34615 RepID=A0AC60PDY1_IXOPE|nr:hypothetical protein HPB47_005099 [Ixodes persulcatus]
MGKWTAQEPRPPELRKQACLPAWEGRSCENLTRGRDQNLTGGWQMYLGGIQPRPSALPPSALQKLHEDHAAPWLLAVSPERDRANCTGTAGAGLSWDVGAAGEPPPRREGARCPWVGFGVLRAAARSSSKTWVALDSIRGAGPRRATSAYEPCARNDQRFLASRTPVYGKRGPKWCIASPGGPRRVQTYPGFGSTTRMPFSPDTGKPRTARRGCRRPLRGSGSVETPLSKHLLSQVPPAGVSGAESQNWLGSRKVIAHRRKKQAREVREHSRKSCARARRANATYFFETLPNLTVIFRLNFSKLKLIKTSLRSTMSDERLSNLSILSIEKERVKNINFTTVINNFAEAKFFRFCSVNFFRCDWLRRL